MGAWRVRSGSNRSRNGMSEPRPLQLIAIASPTDCRCGIAKRPAAIHHGRQWEPARHSQAGQGRRTMPVVLNLISRIVLSAVFIVYGYLAFADVKAWVNFNQVALKRFFYIVAGGMATPTWFGYLIATIQLVGGLAILAGFKTRWVPYAFVAYLVLVDFSAHNFWDMQGAARGANMAHFYKNLAIIGGFLLLALQGAGRYSVDGQMSRSWLSRQMSRTWFSRR